VIDPLIARLPELLTTQDNRITADPMFIVQQKRRIYGLDPDRCDNVVWLDETGDYAEASEEEHRQLEQAWEDGEETSNWYRCGVMDTWEFVTACLTEQGCKDYLDVNGHNLNKPRIYAASGYRNAEWIALRKHHSQVWESTT
jgi:hypothetical protein